MGKLSKCISLNGLGVLGARRYKYSKPFGFAGRQRDRDTSLVYFGGGHYNPGTGRWMQKDPIGFAGQDTNLYRYVNNDPVNFIDPSGEIIFATIMGAYVAYEIGFALGATYNKFAKGYDYSKTYREASPVVNLLNTFFPYTGLLSDPNTQKALKNGLNNQREKSIDEKIKQQGGYCEE